MFLKLKSIAVVNLTLISLSFILLGCFHETNHPPTANVGQDISASFGQEIRLDGSNSSDVDGDSLSYSWEITQQPENSNATLRDPNTVSPSLIVDRDGTYVVKLVVSDGDQSSKADFLNIFTSNDPPIAVAKSIGNNDNKAQIGDLIELNAIESSDPENSTVFYHWQLVSKPENSLAELNSETIVNPSFEIDKHGPYIVHLIVDDGIKQSRPATLIFNAEAPARLSSTLPIAEAGNDIALFTNVTSVLLDGSGSSDFENDTLSYAWEILSKPRNASANLVDGDTVSPELTFDKFGHYVVSLVVSDVDGNSNADTVVITPHESPGLFCADCHNGVIAKGKRENHILVYDDCRDCHLTTAFTNRISNNINHSHGINARPWQCGQCHNGVIAVGKGLEHIITDVDCNLCHLIFFQNWSPALKVPGNSAFEHIGIVTLCVDCHDNTTLSGKPEGHVVSTDRCAACHLISNWLPATPIEHNDALGVCIDCHNRTIQFRPRSHIPTSNNCLGCHHSVDQWLPIREVNHDEVFGICFDCHNNIRVKGKGIDHIDSSGFCDECHLTSSWLFIIN